MIIKRLLFKGSFWLKKPLDVKGIAWEVKIPAAFSISNNSGIEQPNREDGKEVISFSSISSNAVFNLSFNSITSAGLKEGLINWKREARAIAAIYKN